MALHALRWYRASIGFLMLLGGAILLNACTDPITDEPETEPAMELQDVADDASSRTGLYTYFADAALFTDCVNGERLPVAPSTGSLALERAWLAAARTLDQPLLVEMIASEKILPGMEEGTMVRQLVVEQLIRISDRGVCPQTSPDDE